MRDVARPHRPETHCPPYPSTSHPTGPAPRRSHRGPRGPEHARPRRSQTGAQRTCPHAIRNSVRQPHRKPKLWTKPRLWITAHHITGGHNEGARHFPGEKAMDRDTALDTYRYLRGGIPVMLVMLGAALIIERARATCWQTSISAYYFTAAHAVFIGAICAIGTLLIVYKGSTDTEDVLLNLAGILAFVVAFVPTSRPVLLCGASSLPVDAVTNAAVVANVWALVVALVRHGSRRGGCIDAPVPPTSGHSGHGGRVGSAGGACDRARHSDRRARLVRGPMPTASPPSRCSPRSSAQCS